MDFFAFFWGKVHAGSHFCSKRDRQTQGFVHKVDLYLKIPQILEYTNSFVQQIHGWLLTYMLLVEKMLFRKFEHDRN